MLPRRQFQQVKSSDQRRRWRLQNLHHRLRHVDTIPGAERTWKSHPVAVQLGRCDVRVGIAGQVGALLGLADARVCKYGDARDESQLAARLARRCGLRGSIRAPAGVGTRGCVMRPLRHSRQSPDSMFQATFI